MRQRNDTSDQLFVQAADPPFTVEPGETIDYKNPIIGMTAVEEEPSPPAADDVKAPKKAAKAVVSGEEPAE